MKVKISKWGNSLALRIPSSIARSIHLVAGDEVELKEAGDKIVLERRRVRSYDLDMMLSEITPETLHPETQTERTGNEAW